MAQLKNYLIQNLPAYHEVLFIHWGIQEYLLNTF